MKHLKDFNEMIKVPIKVGDTILGGRFKNKKTLVKKIGKNDKGDITINGKPLLKYRIVKESLQNEMDMNLAHLIDSGFIINVDESDGSNFVRIWLPNNKSDNKYSYGNSKDFNWSDIEDELARGLHYITESYEVEYLYTIASADQDGSKFKPRHGFNRMEWDIENLMKNGTFGYANPGIIKCVSLNLKPF